MDLVAVRVVVSVPVGEGLAEALGVADSVGVAETVGVGVGKQPPPTPQGSWPEFPSAVEVFVYSARRVPSR